jgi:hypothetical protein
MIGETYSDRRDFQKAVESFLQAIALFRATGNKEKVADCMKHVGFSLWLSGDNRKASEYMHQALDLYNAIGNTLEADGLRRSMQLLEGIE